MCFLAATAKTATTGLSVATWIGLCEWSAFVFKCGLILTYKCVVRLVSTCFDVVRLFATLSCWIHESLGVLLIPGLSLHWHFLNASMQLETIGNPCDMQSQELCHWHNSSWDALSVFSRTSVVVTTNTAKCLWFQVEAWSTGKTWQDHARYGSMKSVSYHPDARPR